MRATRGGLVMGGVVAAMALLVTGCYVTRPSAGAGQTAFNAPRRVDPASLVLPGGYRAEVLATGLTFPVGVAWDGSGNLHVVESGYSYGEVFTEPRLLRIEADGSTRTIAAGGKGGPWTGVAFHRGNFYIADGNVLEGGRVIRVTPSGQIEPLVTGLPSFGDHHTNGPVVGPDGWIYFGQGTATNSGVVGADNAKFGWLERHPNFHDIPAQDIELTGENFESDDVRVKGSRQKVLTGAFLPFGTPSKAGQVIRGAVRSSGSVLRVRPEGGEPELVAWGFRNPFGLAFGPDNQLYVTDNGYDDRGSRRVWGSPDMLWRVQPGGWYGWPDYVAGIPITDEQFRGPGNKPLKFVLAKHPATPPRPIAQFSVHSSADGLDFSRSAAFDHVGQAFVAIFGDQAPDTGKILTPVGGKIVRVNLETGIIHDFAVNRAPVEGPATRAGGLGFERPVAVKFDPTGEALYVVDFGVLQMDASGATPHEKTGVIWRIRKEGAR